MAMKGGKGMNPDTKETNLTILCVLFTLLFGVYSPDTLPPQITGTVAVILCLRTTYQLIIHFTGFLKHMATLRRARIIYEETGQKTDRSIQGYASLNTLMLSAVICIIGSFILAMVAHFGFTYQSF